MGEMCSYFVQRSSFRVSLRAYREPFDLRWHIPMADILSARVACEHAKEANVATKMTNVIRHMRGNEK